MVAPEPWALSKSRGCSRCASDALAHTRLQRLEGPTAARLDCCACTHRTAATAVTTPRHTTALYSAAARRLAQLAPHIRLSVFSDRDIATRRGEVAAALSAADCFFGSLLFDYDTVEWLRGCLGPVPVVLVFESALELMGLTRIGSFTMDPSGECCVGCVWGCVWGGGALCAGVFSAADCWDERSPLTPLRTPPSTHTRTTTTHTPPPPTQRMHRRQDQGPAARREKGPLHVWLWA